eukprot:272384-Pyramimonas_sp.AAC.1
MIPPRHPPHNNPDDNDMKEEIVSNAFGETCFHLDCNPLANVLNIPLGVLEERTSQHDPARPMVEGKV